MTFTRVKPAGWTDDIDTITAAELNALDINITRAIDGNAGGSYSPSANINVTDGSGGGFGNMDFRGASIVRSGGTITMQSGSTHAIASGATMTMSGTQNIPSGGRMTFASGSLHELSVGANIADGAGLTLDGLNGEVRRFDAPGALRQHQMIAAAAVGRKALFIRDTAGAFDIEIWSPGLVDVIVTLPASTWASALVYDTGATWRLLHTSGGTPGAGA